MFEWSFLRYPHYINLVRGGVRTRAGIAGVSVPSRGPLGADHWRPGGRHREKEEARHGFVSPARHGARTFRINSGIHQVSIELIQNRIRLSSI